MIGVSYLLENTWVTIHKAKTNAAKAVPTALIVAIIAIFPLPRELD
jgi:hypothetical protein